MEATEELQLLARRVCENVADYVGSQLDGSIEEMELLRQVVLSIDAKYGDMQREAQRLGKLSKVLKLKAHAMESKMKTIDAIDDELTDLEDMVDQLDRYTGSLESTLRQMERAPGRQP